MSSWACVSGRRTPRPPSRHVVHAWIPGTRTSAGRRLPRRRPTHPVCAAPGLGDRPALARSRLPLRAAVPHPRGDPVGGSAREARRPLPGTPAVCAGARPPAPRGPRGSSPVATAASRAAARATTPSAEPNGARASSSPWTTATTTGAGAAVPPVTRSASSARRAATWASGRGRPRSGSAARSAAASTCSRASACSGRGAPDPQQAALLLRDAHRTGQYRTGHGVVRPGERRPVQSRGRPRRAQARLRRGRGPSAAVHRVVVQLDERVAGPFDGRGQPGQRHDRSERICRQRHSARVSRQCEPARQDGAHQRLRALRSSP